MDDHGSAIGLRLPLEDAYSKVTGKLKFAGDVRIDGVLHAKLLRSPHAHARIVGIDTGRAEALTGVKAVLTYRDVLAEWSSVGFNFRTPVLDQRVRFVGDEVAAVAATSARLAQEATRLIDVEYEELPHVFDMEEAMKPDAPLVSPHGNVRKPSIIDVGAVERGFKEADIVVEHRTTMGTQQHAPLDRNACVAAWEHDRLTIWTGTQTPSQMRDEIAQLLRMPQNKVRVIALPVGGSFGLWWVNRFHLITVVLARKARRPVRLELTREEVFATVKRRETPSSWGKLGVKKDGSFTAIHVRHYFDNGAHGFKSDPYHMIADLWGGKTPNLRFEMYGISTNRVTGGCMRGVGGVTVGFAMEQLIDAAAEKLGMDPIEIRLKNHIRAGDPLRMKVLLRFPVRDATATVSTADLQKRVLSSCALDECIRVGAKLIEWDKKWKGWRQPSFVDGPRRRGVGMSVGQTVCSIASLGAPGAIVRINQDGSVYLLTGAGRPGQGIETTQAQIAAEELGVPVESIVGLHGDTDACPWSMPIYGDLGAHQLGLATRAAAADAKRQLCEVASTMLGAPVDKLDIKGGMIHVKGRPETGVPITSVTGAIAPPASVAPPTIIGRGWESPPQSPVAASFMAHFAEVEVDTETGAIRVLRYVAVHDSGRIINPSVCENQVAGGVIQGLGLALTESLVFDEETGEVLNPNFVDYKIPRALDVPDVESAFVEVPDPVGPFGIKGLGEATVDCAPAAIAQAILNATGLTFNHVPITPEKLLKAWKSRSAKPSHS